MPLRAFLVLLPALTVLAACGSSGGSGSGVDPGKGAEGARFLPEAAQAALHPHPGDFPQTKGRSLQQLANSVTPGFQVGLAASTYVPGSPPQRVPFALLDRHQRPVYGPTAVYVASGAGAPASGPYIAPGDSLVVDPAYRSKTTDASDIKLVYHASVPMPRAGRYALLVVTRDGHRLLGGATSLEAKATAIPGPGQRAPRIDTPTVKSVHGDIAAIDTRIPHDDMHDVDFRDALGHKPIALIISTPALCQSRVCGPVTDVMMQIQQRDRDKVDFIHQEVYVDNQIRKGLRPQLKAFHLESEPWLFTVDRHGRIAARLEGAFGLSEAQAAVKAAMRK